MTDANTQAAGLNNLQQSMHAQLFAIDSHSRVLHDLCGDEEQLVIQGLVQDVRELVEGVEEAAAQLGTMTPRQKARRNRAEKRLAAEICDKALALSKKQCQATESSQASQVPAITLEQKAHKQVVEQNLARDICNLALGKPVKAASAEEAEEVRSMLVTYRANQGILNIALDTGNAVHDCKCEAEQEARQRLTLSMQIRTICRIALDFLHVAGC